MIDISNKNIVKYWFYCEKDDKLSLHFMFSKKRMRKQQKKHEDFQKDT